MDSRVIPVTAAFAAGELNAKTQYNILIENIRDIESELSADDEISLMLASFGQAVTMQVTDIGFHGKIMIFYGFVDGRVATLFQHMSQLNFLVLVLPKTDPGKPARRIGFKSDSVDE